MRLQLPSAPAVVVPSEAPARKTSTLAPGSAVPLTVVGVMDAIAGAAGAVVSTRITGSSYAGRANAMDQLEASVIVPPFKSMVPATARPAASVSPSTTV